VTNDRPWRLADLTFVPSGGGRERATIAIARSHTVHIKSIKIDGSAVRAGGGPRSAVGRRP
jgi:hypothetical protein